MAADAQLSWKWKVYAVRIIVLVLVYGQPATSKGFVTSCCSYILSANQLLQCLTAENQYTLSQQSTTFATFFSPEIHSYAAYSLLVNSLYFGEYDYSFRVLSAETGDDYDPSDRRWNKIRAIPVALTGWASAAEYLVFIDADLIILRHDLDITALMDLHPAAQVLMSADAIDVANTGFIIVRNTEWSIRFFRLWWSMRGVGGTHCDQHVLNRLLSQLRLDDKGGAPSDAVHSALLLEDLRSLGGGVDLDVLVCVLDSKALNSRWPAIEHFEPSDTVLHLMGETNATRNAVLRRAAEVVCERHWNHSPDGGVLSPLPPALGFTRDSLWSLAFAALTAQVEAQLAECEAAGSDTAPAGPVQAAFESLHSIVSHLCVDAAKHTGADSVASGECSRFLHRAYEANKTRRDALARVAITSDDRQQQQQQQQQQKQSLFHLDQMAMLLFDALQHGPDGQKADLGRRVLGLLDETVAAVDMRLPANQVYVSHKRGIVFGSLSEFAQASGDWARSLEFEKVAVSEYAAVLQLVATGSGSDGDRRSSDMDGFVIEYVFSALRLSRAFQRLGQHPEALDWSRIAASNGDLLFATYAGELRTIASERRRLYEQHVSVCAASGLVEEASKYSRLLADLA